MDVMNARLEIVVGGDKTLEFTLKEPNPTAIFLNESRLAWERRQCLLSEKEKCTIGKTIQFNTDTSAFDFLQASSTAIIMAITGLECYANHKIRELRESRKTISAEKGGNSNSIEAKFNSKLPAMTNKDKPSANSDIKDCWEEFKTMNEIRNQLIHATAERMQSMNVGDTDRTNTWTRTLQTNYPHRIAIRLIKYFEDEEPEWLKQFPAS